MARLYAWWSESGGAGKTTDCVNTSAAIGRDGHDVIAIDVDPQRGSLTHHVGHGDLLAGDQENTIMDVFFEGVDPREIIVETEHFDVLPGHEDLANFQSELNNSGRRGLNQFTVIRDVVEDLADDYDYIIVDCPATLTELTDNAIFATRNVMVPLELTAKGEASQEGLEETIGEMHDGFSDLGVEISINGCVPSRVGNAKIFEEYRDHFESEKIPISPFSIPEHSSLKYAWKAQMDIFGFMESDETRDLRPYEEHVPLAFKVVGRMMTGEYTYEDAIEHWDRVKDQEMGDADPEALLDDDEEEETETSNENAKVSV